MDIEVMMVKTEWIEKYGFEESALLWWLAYWIKKNVADENNFYDGKTWTYNSKKGWAEFFPFWTEKQIRRLLENLIKRGAIVTGRYNKQSFDKTLWYALSDSFQADRSAQTGQSDQPKRANLISPNGPTNTNKEIHKEEHKRIFDHWNSKSLIKHKSISKAMTQNIADRLKENTVDELTKCIDNYDTVVNNVSSWYTYRSALDDFFRGGVKKPAPYLKFMPERFVATNFIKEQRDVQQTLFGDDDIPVKPTYPETSVIMNKLYSLFPGGHEYLFFPQDSDTAAWRQLHDLILTKPREQQKQAVIEAMKGLGKK